ncbi:MAG: asparagine synthase (glutamine-hydrolyzing) [Verrucomicrobiota bacterium]
MCGIAGYVSWASPPEAAVLRAMERTLAHRGPDEGSIWCDRICGLAHRRLRIIDLSPLAAQPMSNETGDLKVILNGEIYNFLELRKELETLGHTFKSRSDTEVLLHGYESWGENLFEKLRGMFALAIWDQRNEQLIFGRDRLGKKPFFFAEDAGRFVFGSELAVFRQLPDLTLSISPSAFCEYIEFGYVQSPRTILEKVQQLPPGHFGILNREDLRLHPFWALPEVPPARTDDADLRTAAENLEQPFHDAVRCRLISDVPLGCFLSGGIDSSLVAAHAQELVSGRLKTYTVGFENSSMNEATHAAEIARHLGTDHHEIMISPQTVIDEFTDILARATEPIGDDSFLPTFLISRETRREVTVALSGDGGDELFCGYTKYKQFSAAQRLRQLLPRAARTAALSLVGSRGSDGLQKRLEALALPNDESVARWLSTLWKESELEELIDPRVRSRGKTDEFSSAWSRRRNFPALERFMLTDMETYLTGDILAKVDRASMAHGLEVRNPLLDQNFIATAFQFSCRARPGKILLKEMLSKRIPRQLFERPKHGFGMPVNEWYRGPLRQVLEHYTSEARIRERGLLNAGTVQDFVQSHLAGRRNFGRKLHSIVAFEIWADEFFGRG